MGPRKTAKQKRAVQPYQPSTVRMRVSAHCADAFLNVSFSGFYRTGVRRLRPVRRQRTLCGIRIKSFGALFVSAPLCGDSDLCNPDRNQSAVVGCLDVWVLSSIFDENNERDFKKINPVLTIIYWPIAYEHRPTRDQSTAVEPVIQAPAVPHV